MRWACSTQCFASSFQSGQMSLTTFLASIRVLGLDGVELASEHLPSLRQEFLSTLATQLAEHDLAVVGLSWTVPTNGQTGQEMRAVLERLMITAHRLRARTFCLLGATDWQIRHPLITVATELGERLNLPVGLAWSPEQGDPEALLQLLDDFNSPYLGACLTLTPALRPDDPAWNAAALVAPFAIHVHLAIPQMPRSLAWFPAFALLQECEYADDICLIQVPDPPESSLVTLMPYLRQLV